MEGERRRIAHTGGDGRLVRTVGIEALDCRFWLGLDPDIARRADPDIKAAGLRIDREMPVLMADSDAEYALLRQHLRAVGAGHRLALVRRHLVGTLRRHRAAGPQCADD